MKQCLLKNWARLTAVVIPLCLLSMSLALAAQPLSAQLLTSAVTDPIGDASAVTPAVAPLGYQDIVNASVTLKDGRFVFVMDVASAIPSSPPLPHGVNLLEWSFRLRTDLSTCAFGFPFPPARSTASPELTHCSQYMVFVVWDGTGYVGMLVDRTRTVTGDVVVMPISFSIDFDRGEITASVESSKINAPESFRWISRTQTWFGQLGTIGYLVVDAAPAEGTFATWPNN